LLTQHLPHECAGLRKDATQQCSVVEDIYYQVNNEDVLAFSEQKTATP
jgi:hypothetical protein